MKKGILGLGVVKFNYQMNVCLLRNILSKTVTVKQVKKLRKNLLELGGFIYINITWKSKQNNVFQENLGATCNLTHKCPCVDGLPIQKLGSKAMNAQL